MNTDKINQCVEAICECGCETVLAVIEVMESGNPVPQVELLQDAERGAVLNELKAIMSVYGNKACSLPKCSVN